ncbi:MAG: Fe-S cluster assembly protein SufD, partial [Aureliella sp.]
MSSATLPSAFSREGFESWLSQLSEPAWLIESRRRAWADFEEMKWPDRSLEEWMRSDLRPFKLDRYSMPGAGGPAAESTSRGAADASVPQWLSEGVELAGRIETLDSLPVKSQLSQQWASKGVLFGDLSQLAGQHEDLVRSSLFS